MQLLTEAYEQAAANERAAFAALLEAPADSPKYRAQFRQWELATRAAEAARNAMLRGVATHSGLESGGTG
jgi:hypothetical protein